MSKTSYYNTKPTKKVKLERNKLSHKQMLTCLRLTKDRKTRMNSEHNKQMTNAKQIQSVTRK